MHIIDYFPMSVEQLEQIARRLQAAKDLIDEAEVSILEMPLNPALAVREFTLATGRSVPDTPRPMTYDEVKFLIGMKLSEMVEFAQTVTPDADTAVELVRGLVATDLKSNYVKPTDPIDIIADQADAEVDSAYYGFNAFAKCGVNLARVFDQVHTANMAKRFPDGTFHKREDNKVIKPPGWREPDIRAEIARQYNQGSWNW
jgi:predicted HAD superfamily Cof-like phosphohydrolase